jgi:mono/diheme cytochrome c family protein/plastocyanin
MADTPEPGSEERLPVPRPPAEVAPVERFSGPPQTRSVELTPERAAQVVRSSSNARWVGFLAVVIVVLFAAVYWFYEIAPLGITESRLDAETASQQVISIERGYNLFQANCARCHGKQGEGGIGPALNRQDKLYAHLSVEYIDNVLFAGGRYVCGDPNSVMPVWSNEGHPAGPLNYVQLDDLIAFIRAPSNETFIIRDPSLGEPLKDPITGQTRTFNGWRDVNYKPAPGATPYPNCWKDEFTSASAGPSGSPAASVNPNAPTVTIEASGIAFTTSTVTAPSTAFTLEFNNQDAGTPHNVQIKDSTGKVAFQTDTFNGVETRKFQVPALAAGTYPFVCTVHPTMMGTLTVQ